MKRILKALAFISVVIIIGYLIVMNLPKANIKSKAALETITADQLYNSFESDEQAAEKKYIGQVINVSGKVADRYEDESGAMVLLFENESGTSTAMVTLEESQTKAAENVKLGDLVEVKALCTGKLMEVVLAKGIINVP